MVSSCQPLQIKYMESNEKHSVVFRSSFNLLFQTTPFIPTQKYLTITTITRLPPSFNYRLTRLLKYSCSSTVLTRFSTALRVGYRPNLSITLGQVRLFVCGRAVVVGGGVGCVGRGATGCCEWVGGWVGGDLFVCFAVLEEALHVG